MPNAHSQRLPDFRVTKYRGLGDSMQQEGVKSREQISSEVLPGWGGPDVEAIEAISTQSYGCPSVRAAV